MDDADYDRGSSASPSEDSAYDQKGQFNIPSPAMCSGDKVISCRNPPSFPTIFGKCWEMLGIVGKTWESIWEIFPLRSVAD